MTVKISDVSAIICAYTERRWHVLLAAVDSLKRQTLPPLEIIVVIDNNLALLERARMTMTQVIVIENRQQQGLSGARNSGVAQARGAFIAFLDDDASAAPDWLEKLRQHGEDKAVLGVGGVVEPLWDKSTPLWFPKEFYWVIGCSYFIPPATTVVRNPYGGCTCIRREVFEVLGGFRNDMGRVGTRPMGGEETELCIRALQHWPQKVFLCEPTASIQHHIPVERANWRYFCSRCFAEGLSKARVTSYVGAGDSLSAERAYMLRLLPLGVIRGVYNGLLCLEGAGFLRAFAILLGLAITILGYISGVVQQFLSGRGESELAKHPGQSTMIHGRGGRVMMEALPFTSEGKRR